MSMYIKRGKFTDFVLKIFETKQKEEQEKQEKDEDWKLWVMYTRLLPKESFSDWKASLTAVPQVQGGRDEDLTDAGIMDIIGQLFPER